MNIFQCWHNMFPSGRYIGTDLALICFQSPPARGTKSNKCDWTFKIRLSWVMLILWSWAFPNNTVRGKLASSLPRHQYSHWPKFEWHACEQTSQRSQARGGCSSAVWFAFCLWRPQCVKNWRSTCIHCGGQAFREHFLSFQKKKSKAQTNYWSLEVVWCLSVRACKKGGMQWSSKFRTLGDFWEIPPALVKDIVTVGDINVQIKPAAL